MNRCKSIGIVVLFSILLIACTEEPHTLDAPDAVAQHSALQLVNKARTNGCNCGSTYYPPVPALSWDEQLEAAAQAHSDDMNRRNRMAHQGGDGSNPGVRITRTGYAWSTYGENIAEGYTNEESVVEAWLESTGHCKNIMNGSFTQMGMATSGTYWTQVFAAPR
jgi:uncharacterized protein YkwD